MACAESRLHIGVVDVENNEAWTGPKEGEGAQRLQNGEGL